MKKLFASVLIAAVLLTGCAPAGTEPGGDSDPPPAHPTGIYTLVSIVENGRDTTAHYVSYTVELKEGAAEERKVTRFRGAETEVVPLTYGEAITGGGRTYALEGNSLSVSKEGVQAVFTLDEDYQAPATKGTAAFTDELFGEDLTTQQIYNYCPTAFIEADEMHIYYCKNRDSGNVTDYVAYRKGTLQGDGKWSFSEAEHVLAPTAGSWDARHVCDPDVVKGSFSYGGTEYAYLMAYLGCVTGDNSNNEVGLAVAEKPAGPWIKVGSGPICKFEKDGVHTGWEWGYGQPALVNTSRAGEVVLFYTQGIWSGTHTVAERWDFSDLDAPLLLERKLIGERGLQGTKGASDYMNNASFAYDGVNRRIYALTESHPINAEDGNPTFVSSHNQLVYINEAAGVSKPFGTVFGAGYLWRSAGYIGPAQTGFQRNHNMGLVTDPYGWTLCPDEIPLVYTMSMLDRPNNSLWTYRLHGYVFEV